MTAQYQSPILAARNRKAASELQDLIQSALLVAGFWAARLTQPNAQVALSTILPEIDDYYARYLNGGEL